MRHSRRSAPPWWPHDEPWPPYRRFGGATHHRAWFFRKIAFAMFAFLVLGSAGIAAITLLLSNRGSFSGPTLALGLFALLFVAGFLLVAMFGGMRRFVSPLRSVMDAADKVAAGDYSVRVHEHGPPPMRALAKSFNTMTERLQNADRVRRDLMSDIAHELRTPLSVLQGRIEGLLDGVYPREDAQLSQLLEETHLLSRLVDDLRTLALSDAGALPLQKEPTDLAALARDVVRSMETDATRQLISMTVSAHGETRVLEVDPLRVREVLLNLLSNAIRHTPSGGTITLEISGLASGVAIRVSDTGAGMPPEELAHVFDRFYKGAASRGSGLGLTIAKGIMIAHGGTIDASSEVGKGTTVTCSFPGP